MATIYWNALAVVMVTCINLLETMGSPYVPQKKGEFYALSSSSSLSSPRGHGLYSMPLEDQRRQDWSQSAASGVKFVAYSGVTNKNKKGRKRRMYEPAPAEATMGLLQNHPHGKPKRPIFCYYGSSANTRPSVGKFFPENIDPFLCTHLIFAFVDIKKDGTGIKPNNIDDLTDKGLYARTVALKKKNPDLKVLLAVGGWKIGSKPFLPVIKDRSTWKIWIDDVIHYLREHNFDGFDMDWEFPGWRGSGPEDQHKFTLLMKDLHEAFAQEAMETGKPRLLLTLATASSVFYIEKSYEPSEIYKHIDYMLLMTYNYHGSGWEKHTGHHSPILPHPLDPEGEQRELSVLWSVKYWLQFGVPKEKLIVGIPTYGLGWKLTDPSNTGVRAPADGGNTKGKYTGESGILSHFEICEHIIQDGWQVEWIDSQKVPYAHGDNEWVGFESPDSIYIKALTIVKEGLGGAFIWSVEMDDFSGHCGGPKYPLLRTVYEVFTKASLSASLSAAASHTGISSSASSGHGHVQGLSGHHEEEGREEEEEEEEEEEGDYHSYYDEDPSSSLTLSHDYEDDESWSDYADDYEYEEEESSNSKSLVDCHDLGLGIHADPYSCYHFILCMPSSMTSVGASRMACPGGTLYDKSLKICNHEYAVKCEV